MDRRSVDYCRKVRYMFSTPYYKICANNWNWIWQHQTSERKMHGDFLGNERYALRYLSFGRNDTFRQHFPFLFNDFALSFVPGVLHQDRTVSLFKELIGRVKITISKCLIVNDSAMTDIVVHVPHMKNRPLWSGCIFLKLNANICIYQFVICNNPSKRWSRNVYFSIVSGLHYNAAGDCR